MEVNIKISKKVFNDVYIPYLGNTDRYLIFYGGAGSGKSFFIVERYIYKILNSKLMNLLTVRATGKSNRDSTFALFKQVINKWHLGMHFKINESDLRIKCLLNGNEIIFSGLDDVEKLKSVTFSKGELTDIWIEEASEILESDFIRKDARANDYGFDDNRIVSVKVELADDDAKTYLTIDNTEFKMGTEAAAQSGTEQKMNTVTIGKNQTAGAIINAPTCKVNINILDKWGMTKTASIYVKVNK